MSAFLNLSRELKKLSGQLVSEMLLDSRNFSATSMPTMLKSILKFIPRPGMKDAETILTKREPLSCLFVSATTSEFRTAIPKNNT